MPGATNGWLATRHQLFFAITVLLETKKMTIVNVESGWLAIGLLPFYATTAALGIKRMNV